MNKQIDNVGKYQISVSVNIRQAAKQLDIGGIGFVAVIDVEEKVLGIITDGDFRRSVLSGTSLDDNVKTIINTDFVSVLEFETDKVIINAFLYNKIERLPIIGDGKLLNILLREDFDLDGKVFLPEKSYDIPVVIMAGGKGTRMAPFTNIFPKPLIPFGDRSMLEVIMDEYSKYGLVNFFLTINYKGNLIKAYFEDFAHDYKITYVTEKKYLGTAGAIKLIGITGNTPIFVSNCDILISENYLDLLDFHNTGSYDLTLIAAIVHHQVPYGVCTIKNGGELDKLSEKPEYDYLVNSGMYILNSTVLDLIPENKFFHITHLMESIKENGGTVGVYPVSKKSWIDVGNWEEYNKSSELLKR